MERRGEEDWTHAALIVTGMYAVFGTANYVVQLSTVIPARLRGAAHALTILEQAPHSPIRRWSRR